MFYICLKIHGSVSTVSPVEVSRFNMPFFGLKFFDVFLVGPVDLSGISSGPSVLSEVLYLLLVLTVP